ncbi:MAG TPA: pyridoxamine 5'-phosphate oxidase [Gemmatimonadaceae bacterium]|nr:pyridoxamine 5'-phosphate oxidase [Gemmatimonadaceae bacterium]
MSGTAEQLDRVVSHREPFDRFVALLEDAKRVSRDRLPEPTAFALGTCDDGQPSVRMLLLKGVDERGFVFYTNYESRKGRALQANARAAMCFHWQPLELQVRVEGSVEPVSEEEADAYFASRARGSQLGAWASRQSRPIEHAGDLEARVAEYERRFEGRPVPRPPYWSGFRVLPRRIEFWRGMASRLHQRQLYSSAGTGWKVETLYP